MSYTDHDLETISSKYDDGLTEEQLTGAVGSPGPMAWLLDVVDDWESFSARAAEEHISPEELVRKAIDAYLHAV